MHRIRSPVLQAGALLLDFVVSAAIIWLALFLYLGSPLHDGEIESFAEILGVFSIFSVLFYSTFLTRVWTWAYILSTWLMRAAVRLRLAHWFDVAGNPVAVLGVMIAVVVFVAGLAISGPMRKDTDGLTAVDRALCSVFRGRVCVDVAALTTTEKAQLELVTLACVGGVTEECLRVGGQAHGVTPEQAAWLLSAACTGGEAFACTLLGIFHEEGIGMEVDVAEAARLYRMACDGGVARGCSSLGFLHEAGIGVEPDAAEAARSYRLACEKGDGVACLVLEDLPAD